MKTLHVTCLLLFFRGIALTAQPSETFLGGDGPDLIARIVPASDGTFWATGAKTVDDHRQVWLIHLSETGSVLMDTTIPPPTVNREGYGHQLVFLEDGTILICGAERPSSGTASGSGMAMNVDTSGNLIWKRTYVETAAIYDAVPTGAGILLGGWKDNTGSTDEGFIMLADALGEGLWTKQIKVNSQSSVRRIFPTTDGRFILVGRSNVIGAGFQGIFLRKVEADGSQIWQTTYDTDWREDYLSSTSNYFTQPLGAVQTTDGSIWVTNAAGYASDIALVRFSGAGDVLQEHIYQDPLRNEVPFDLAPMPDGGWLISGQVSTGGSLPQGLAMAVDSSGFERWHLEYGSGSATERLFSTAGLSDKQWLMAGMSDHLSGNGNDDGWLLRAEADGNILPWTIEGRIVLDLNANCSPDPGEPVLKNWFVEWTDTVTRFTLSDSLGYFTFRTGDGATTLSVLLPEPTDIWQMCNNNEVVVSDAGNPTSFITFLVQPADAGCPHTEISLTQPDLIRCDTSTFVVSLQNRGAGASGPLILRLIPDPELTILSASEPFFVTGDGIEFDIEPMDIFQQRSLEFQARLSCDVQLGATHGIMAGIQPKACVEEWEGARFGVQGVCTGGQVEFTLTNDGGGGAGAQTHYRVLADDLLLADWTEISLPEGEPPVSLSFPADGRTWRVDVQQAPGFPGISRPSAAVEGCGTGKNGLHSITFRNAWPADDGNPETAWVLAPNTTGVPDKIAEAVHGFGYYNLVGNTESLEYTARIWNSLDTTVERAEFRFSFSANLDVRTFRVVASPSSASLALGKPNQMRVAVDQLHILPGESVMIRFRIQPFPDTPPDEGKASSFIVEADAYLNGKGPFPLPAGYHNFSDNFLLEEDYSHAYPPDILRFGGRYHDFASSLATAPDGSVFLVGESKSYSENIHTDGLLIKTDSKGKAYWLDAIDLGDRGVNTFKGVVPLADGGCMVSGNYRPPSATNNYLSSYYAYVARLDAAGHMVWNKKLRPGGSQYGASANGLLPTADGQVLLFGYTDSATGGTDQFYMKIDLSGPTIWKKHSASSTSAFKPGAALTMPDGGFAFLGPNNNQDIYIERIDADGNKLWSKGYIPSSSFTLGGFAQTPEGGFMVNGSTFWEINPGDYGITPTFVRFSPDGEILWKKNIIVGPFQSALPYNLIPAPGGGYFSVGEILADTVNHFTDILLMKTDENADTLWTRHYGARNTEFAKSILLQGTDHLLMWGYNQPAPPLYDLHTILVRTDLNGDVMVGTEPAPETPTSAVVAFPNPARDILHVLIDREDFPNRIPWQLCDLTGRPVREGTAGSPAFDIALAPLPSGIYVLRFPQHAMGARRVVVR